MAKILFVDDDPQLATMVEDWLAYEKHDVDGVRSGFEGWEKARANKYDLLILDWDLPDLNGIDLLKRFRSSGGTTPVLMLTGHTNINDKEQGLDAGADDYLTKPFHMKELSARIRALLRRSERQVEFLQPLGTGNEEVLKEADLAGTLLASKYEFVRVLGKGGIGIVFLARHPIMEKLVAVKMLHAQQLHADSTERFKREAKAVSRLDHHNIITIHDFGVTERGQPYMVMEFIEGASLADLLSSKGALTPELALEISIQIASGIAHAHDLGIIHRDIKPSNIMLKQSAGRTPVVKILDFGFAKLKDLESKGVSDLTQVGLVFGSPPYMSPEQVRGKPLDERSDIYSLGCVIFECLTARPPYLGENNMEVMIKHLEQSPPSVRDFLPALEFIDDFDAIVTKTLAKSPAGRYQSAEDLRDNLESLRLKLKAAAGGPSA